jgi:hypothetical protein
MSFKDVFLAVVELAGVCFVGAAVGVGVAGWAGFLVIGVCFLLVSWLGARR